MGNDTQTIELSFTPSDGETLPRLGISFMRGDTEAGSVSIPIETLDPGVVANRVFNSLKELPAAWELSDDERTQAFNFLSEKLAV